MGATFKGELQGAGLRIGIVASRFNEVVTARLLEGARTALERHGVRGEDVDVAWVPGAFELPSVAKKLAESRRYDAIVCLGAVIRGETAHFDFVAGEAARGVTQVALETGVPVMFGVVTPNTLEQAMERSGGKIGNRGYDAALGAIEMANLLRQLRPD
jgi:6,7-dimethyl-8-ribityllumazine synthase